MGQMTLDQALHIARQHAREGRAGEAEDIYRQVLRQHPAHAQALNLLGELLAAQDRLDEALACFQKAVELKPDYVQAHNNLGMAWVRKELFADALTAFRRVASLRPDLPEGHCSLGNTLASLRDHQGAIEEYRRALMLRPGYLPAQLNLGTALTAKGDYAAAIAAFADALKMDPGSAGGHGGMGHALYKAGRLDEAVAAYRRSLELDPHAPQTLNNLARAQMDRGEMDEAVASYRHALAAAPRTAAIHSNLVLALHYLPAISAAEICQETRNWNALHASPRPPARQSKARDEAPDRKLRIGYVSGDFREHPVGWFLLPLVTRHDRAQVEVYCYSMAPTRDPVTQRFMDLAAGWREIGGLSDAQAAELIRQDRIDILVDLAMHTEGNRLKVFAQRPAPVQATWLAYPGSTGLTAMDYRLSDPFLDPEDTDLSVYSEKTIRLPETFWCYQASADAGAVTELPARQSGFVTFGCLNNFCKVSGKARVLWAEILKAVPGSRLVVHAAAGSHREAFLEDMARMGVARERCRFVPRVPGREYFAQYQQVDVALDPFPYGGGTTSCDALYMGVPVITMKGNTAVGRGGYSLLSNIGAAELVAATAEEYVRHAVELARDLGRLEHYRATLRGRMERSPLMDAARFARHMEAAYREMWRTWCTERGRG